jgi:hypothetical protein
MGTLAESAIVDYPSSFADQEKHRPFSVSDYSKHTEVSHFHFPYTENKRKLPFSVSSIFEILETWKRGDMETWI